MVRAAYSTDHAEGQGLRACRADAARPWLTLPGAIHFSHAAPPEQGDAEVSAGDVAPDVKATDAGVRVVTGPTVASSSKRVAHGGILLEGER